MNIYTVCSACCIVFVCLLFFLFSFSSFHFPSLLFSSFLFTSLLFPSLLFFPLHFTSPLFTSCSPTFLFLRQGAARRDARRAIGGGIISGLYAFIIYYLAGQLVEDNHQSNKPFWMVFSYNISMMAMYLFILTSSHWLPRRPAMFHYAIFRL